MKETTPKKVSAALTQRVAPALRQSPQVVEAGLFGLLANLRAVILEARQQALQAVDEVQVRTCWIVGRHIVEFEQGGRSRAAYGKSVLAQVSTQLTAEFGKGFDERNLRHMRAFYSTFTNWNALRSELSWTHYRSLLRVDDTAARLWYMNEAATQNWNTRALDRQIGTLYYERLLASKDRQPVRDEAVEKLAEIQATVGIILCAHKDHTVVRYSVLHGNEQLFATKYKLILPSEDELRAELLREQELIAAQTLSATAEGPAQPAIKAKRKTKGATA